MTCHLFFSPGSMAMALIFCFYPLSFSEACIFAVSLHSFIPSFLLYMYTTSMSTQLLLTSKQTNKQSFNQAWITLAPHDHDLPPQVYIQHTKHTTRAHGSSNSQTTFPTFARTLISHCPSRAYAHIRVREWTKQHKIEKHRGHTETERQEDEEKRLVLWSTHRPMDIDHYQHPPFPVFTPHFINFFAKYHTVANRHAHPCSPIPCPQIVPNIQSMYSSPYPVLVQKAM